MFPHTQHCEVIIELVRQEAKVPLTEESTVSIADAPNVEDSKE
jgi:hypothetical protein